MYTINGVAINGSLLPFLQRYSIDFDPQRGFVYLYEYKGAQQTALEAQQMAYARSSIASRLTYNQGGVSVLEVTDSTHQYVLDVWQLIGNDESRDALSHPTMAQLATDLQIAVIRQHLQNYDSATDAFQDSQLANLAGTAAQRFYVLQERGQTDYRKGQYVLRHTTNAPGVWGQNISDFGVEQIYTPSQLLSECSDSGLWINPLSERLQFKIANIPYPAYQPYFQFGWLKGQSTETTTAFNRVDITQEYVLEQWSTDYYAPYGS
jgi:hypothetical protein